MKTLTLILFAMLWSPMIFAKKLSVELGLGLGYQPKMQLTRTGGSTLKVFNSRGFLTFQLHGGLLYKINKQHSIGLSLDLLDVPFYYYYNLTGTQFSQLHPDREKKSNAQNEVVSFDFGLTYRKYFFLAANKPELLLDLTPIIRLNSSPDNIFRIGAAEGSDSVAIYETISKEPRVMHWGGRLQIGLKKQLKKNYVIVGLFYSRVFPNTTGEYYSMKLTPDYNYGIFKVRNHQMGVNLILGFGK